MSLIQNTNNELNKVIKQIEQLLIKELDTDSDNLCFYNDEIKVNYITEDNLKKCISSIDIHTLVPVGEDTLGYSIVLEHIPTGMIIDYFIYWINALDYPSFKFSYDNTNIHRIVRVFTDNVTSDYILIHNNPELFNLLDNLTFKTLMYQNFKKNIGEKG